MVSSCLSTVSAPLGSAVALLCSAVDVAFALMCSACAFKPLHCWRGVCYSAKASALDFAISLSTITSINSAPFLPERAAISNIMKNSLIARKIVPNMVNIGSYSVVVGISQSIPER